MAHNTFEFRFTVPLHDIDAAGVMFFAHIFRHAHDAYEAFMSDIGFSLRQILSLEHHHLPLVHSEADFLMPLRHDDAIRIRLHINRLGRTSYTVDYRFIDGTERELARASTTHVLKDPASGERLTLPADMREALSRYLVDEPD